MADTDLYNSINKPQIPPNPTKFYTHFLYKAIFISIFILILPLFPSQAPDFIHQTINSRSWELLQLLFVGIAVSYGLFSKRNVETEKEHDGAPSYVAGLLQVSSVFDDEFESPSGSDDHNKIQTWNSQYYRGEPIVVVAKESSVLDEHAITGTFAGGGGGGGLKTVEKPLLLPVRSLKNAVSESPMIDSSYLRSNSMRFSSKSEEKTEENVVLRSPIPWRSRSGRMEVKPDAEVSPPLFSQAPSMADSFRFQSSKTSNPSSNSSSQNKIYPSSPSPLSETQSKSMEDVVRKKNSQRSSFSSIPPPPPPPPPPHFLQKYPTLNNSNDSSGNEFRRRTKSFPKEISRKTEDVQKNGRTGAEYTIRTQSDNSLMRGKIDFDEKDLTDDREIESFIQRRNQQMKNFTPLMAEQSFTEYPDEEQQELVQKVAMEAEKVTYESDEEDDENNDKFEELASNGGSDNGGPDVDKKADEFIAKFREQIRLQRIASIRRSTGQISRNAVR